MNENSDTRLTIALSDGSEVSAALTRQGSGPVDDLLILAHGAGQDMDSPFMQAIARQLTTTGRAVLRFNFPYMEAARASGRRRALDRAPKPLLPFHCPFLSVA